MKKKGIFVILFILNLTLLSAKLSANPFTGKKNSPTPVYQGQPSENILKGQRILNQKLGDYISTWKENKNFKKDKWQIKIEIINLGGNLWNFY